MRIDLILGCMFSGKTTELIRLVKRYAIMGKKCVVVNTNLDTRCEKFVQTHDNCNYNAVKFTNLMDFYYSTEYKAADVIGIDEAQFFQDIMQFVHLAEVDNKTMIISGLNGNIDRQPMGHILELIGMVDSIKLLTAVSTNGSDNEDQDAIFSVRESNMDPDVIMPGGSELYRAVTRKEFLEIKNKKQS